MITFLVIGVVSFLGGSNCCTATHLRETTALNRKYQDEEQHDFPTLDDIVLTDPDLTTLATAFVTANLNGTLCNECNFTAFAPTNDAFACLNQTLLELLLTPSWRMHLIDLLSFHVTFPTVDRLLKKDLKDGLVLDMLNGEQVTVRKFKRGIELTSPQTLKSSIVEADILASNGALNKIDSVLIPGFFGVNVFGLGDTFVDFTTFQELMELDGCNGREGLYTILAPDNGAFLSMTDETLMELKNNTIELSFIVDNHIIPGVFPSNTLTDGQRLTTLGGRSVTVSITESKISETERIIRFNGIPAVQSDLLGMNGIAYRFESLVFDPDPASDAPSFVPSDVPSDYPSDFPTFAGSVFDLDFDPDFTVLDDLFDLTGLGDLEGEFTLLAPVNAAWLALGNETLARLRNNVAVLERLLQSHLIVGLIPPSDLVNVDSVSTISGLNVTVAPPFARAAAQQSTFMFNNATSSDIYYARNGIIYKIDEVLFDPLAITLAPTPSPTSSPIEPEIVDTNVPTATPVVEGTLDPTVEPITDAPFTDEPTLTPTIAFCIDYVCDDGYILVSDAATRPGNDRATCCYFGGICAGAPVGAMCALGDIGSSLISNPSFEEFSECPNAPEQISLSNGWIEGADPEYFDSSFFVQSPTCDDTWYRSGALYFGDEYAIGSIPQNVPDGNGFVGTYFEDGAYPSYIGTCLNAPLAAGVEYTLTLNVASPEDDFDYGGDTNGATDLFCISDCSILPYNSYSFIGSEFELLASAEPDGGLLGGGDWKAITFNFVPSTNCAAIVVGPNENQSALTSQYGSYVLYDFLNLQEGAAGMCTAEGECIPVDTAPTFCIDFDCGEGYILFGDAETRLGNDLATCCYRTGVCAGAPVGAMCSLGDIGSSLIPNPSFEEFTDCPVEVSQLFLSTTWVQATDGTSDFFIESPTCDDSWYRNGYGVFIGSIPQNAVDGNAYVGSIRSDGYYEYIGACLNEALARGMEYTFTINVAAPEDNFIYGGDTNAETDLLCIPECGLFPITGSDYKGNAFEILSTAAPDGGLVGGGDWKTITFNFVADSDCPAIMFGPSANQTIQASQTGSYVIYDFLNLQEGAAGMCNAEGECVPVDAAPTFCIDFDCGEGYILLDDAETRPGNDRATCCYRAGVCAGAPVGAMCSLGDIVASLIPNPSFEAFTECPFTFSQLSSSVTWVQATEGTSDLFIESPTCDASWYRNGVGGIGSIPQNASDGDAFVGSIKEMRASRDYYEYIGACLNEPLTVGVEYTFSLDVAAAAGDSFFGGDTNGATDLLCIPACNLFQISGSEYKGEQFEILSTAAPDGGLVGGGDWKTITFNFVANSDCPAIMFGPSANQTIQASQTGSYVIYDFLNLQEGAAGMCNAEGECVPVDSSPTSVERTPAPADASTPAPVVPLPSPTPSSEGCPEECGENEACDPIDGICKSIDIVRPCIAIIDESDVRNSTINAAWKSFRTSYPFRPFCLLIPNTPSDANFFFPTDPNFLNDTRASFAYVERDMGDSTLASNYLNECRYSNLATSGVDFVGLFIDESGSMSRYTVRASLQLLFQNLEEINVNYCTVLNNKENWIRPFNTELASECVSDSIVDFTPTTTPTLTPMPTTTFNPTITNWPTSAPLIGSAVTAEPTAGTGSKRAAKPSIAPTSTPQSMPTQGPTSVTPTKAPVALNVSVTDSPTLKVTSSPMLEPTLTPIDQSTSGPTVGPTLQPMKEATNAPTVSVTKEPIVEPTATPTKEPTPEPTVEPTIEPTAEPTDPPESTEPESNP